MCLLGESLILSVGDWLDSLGLGQYEYTFIANGFDDTDFMVRKFTIHITFNTI